MSLHFIGIRDFPVLHRQFSTPKNSPRSATFESPPSASTKDLARDSKDVLIQRLNDIALRLMTEENLSDEDITSLHLDVDRMERVIRSALETHPDESPLLSSHGRRRSCTTTTNPHPHDDDPFWPPFSPTRQATIHLPDSPHQSHPSPPQPEISPQQALLLVQEANALRDILSHTTAELRARREESSHIHSLLVRRAETAAQRIINLEAALDDVDADLEAAQSEISFLRLQLRALEVQAMRYVPFGADDELAESIRSWKIDWADVDQRTRATRRKYRGLTEEGNELGQGTGTPVGSFGGSGTAVDGLSQ